MFLFSRFFLINQKHILNSIAASRCCIGCLLRWENQIYQIHQICRELQWENQGSAVEIDWNVSVMIFVIIAVALKRARINAKLFSKHGQFDFSIFCTRNSSKNIINNKTQIQQRPIYSDVLKTLFKRWFLHLSCAYTQCLCYIYMYMYTNKCIYVELLYMLPAWDKRGWRKERDSLQIRTQHLLPLLLLYRLMGFFLFATAFSQSNTQNRVLVGILCPTYCVRLHE